MLLSVVFVGVAAFFIYKFKRWVCSVKNVTSPVNCETFHHNFLIFRKIPWINVQTEDSHEKEPEVISTVGQNDTMTKVKLSEFPSQKEMLEKELEATSRGIV